MKNMERPLQWAAFFLIVIPTITRLGMVLSSNLYFSTDPRFVPFTPDGLGFAGAVNLDLLTILGLACALTAEMLSERGIHWLIVLFGLVPIVPLVLHAPSSDDSVFIGSNWLSAAAVMVAAAHLARNPQLRLLMIGAVVASVVPLLVKGLYQITIEHGETVRHFQENRESMLAARGWDAETVNARLYERRLMQREAIGWFSLANVYGSLMAGLAAFWIAAAYAAARSKLTSGWVGIAGLLAGAGLIGVAISFSKGAIAAALLGVFLSGLTLLPQRWRDRVRPLTARGAYLLIALALAVTILVGFVTTGRESVSGVSLSLLVRWHYWQGAADIVLDHPVLGVGPDGFKDAYVLAKPTESPEEVTSPHSVFITWLAGLGIFGIGWIVLSLYLLRLASPSCEPAEESAPFLLHAREGSGSEVSDHGLLSIPGLRVELRASIVVGLFAWGMGWWFNRLTVFPDLHWFFLPLGIIGYIGAMTFVPFLARAVPRGILRWGVFAGLCVVFIHSQIELTLTHLSAGPPFLLLLGAAACAPLRSRTKSSRAEVGWIAPGLVCVMAVLHIVFVVSPARSQDRHLREAAYLMSPVGEVRSQLSAVAGGGGTGATIDLGALQEVTRSLESYGIAVPIEGTMRELASALQSQDQPRVSRLLGRAISLLESGLMELQLQQMEKALEAFTLADEAAVTLGEDPASRWPNSDVPLVQSATLWVEVARIHHRFDHRELRDEALENACAIAEEIVRRRPNHPGVYTFGSSVYRERRTFTGVEAYLEQAIRWQRKAVELDPHGLTNALRLAELLHQLGNIEEAVQWYRRVLEIDRQLHLDPMKQLTDRTRARIERVIVSEGG